MITVWRIALDAARPPDEASRAILSEAERARAARFLRESDRNRWLHGHVALRRILGEALGVSPGTIAYETGPHGKPQLASPTASGVEFNFSDSGEFALAAVTSDGAIGVDIEACRPQPDLALIARSHFSAEEATALLSLPEGEQHAAFYRIWTRKEAYLKALGAGLSYGLGRFAMTHDATDVRLLHVDGDAAEAADWSVLRIAVPSGYDGALAARWPGASVQSKEWRGD
ncbi:MAG: 4'-phosphopantetheinyl transferase superfamily protein [Gemmatimonadetes bacterium]|nr:4'-phosphopantetheinyl transferase superfamily protein [Gemmatimonadota bacterium]